MPRLGMPVLKRSDSSWSFRLGRRLRMEGASSPPAPSPPWHTEQWLSYCRRPGSLVLASRTASCASRRQSGRNRVARSFRFFILGSDIRDILLQVDDIALEALDIALRVDDIALQVINVAL